MNELFSRVSAQYVLHTAHACIPYKMNGHVIVRYSKWLNAVSAWGKSWHITFEPTKSQALTIDYHRPATVLPTIKFNNIQVQEERDIKIVGVRFDSQLSFRGHIREVATRANQRLGLLKRAAHVLDKHGRSRVYNAFV